MKNARHHCANGKDFATLPRMDSTSDQTGEAYQAPERAFQVEAEHYGITDAMCLFIRALWSEDGLMQKELR